MSSSGNAQKNRPDQDGAAQAFDRLRAEARSAAEDESVTPQAVIDAADREVFRLLRKGGDDERRGLLSLLGRLGARGRRVAERALDREGFDDDVRLALLALLEGRDHALCLAFDEVGRELEAGDQAAASDALGRLPATLREVWARRRCGDYLVRAGETTRALLGAEPDLTELLLGTIDRSAAPELLASLAELAATADSRSLQRAVKSTFFRLGQQGVEVPELNTGSAPERATLEKISEAFLSAVDPNGDQAVWILEELPEGGISLLQGIIDEDGGVGQSRAAIVVRRGRDELIRSLESGEGVPTARLPLEQAMAVVEAAYRTNPASAGRDYTGWRRLSRADRRARRRELPTLDDDAQATLLRRSKELLEVDASRYWLLRPAEAERAQKVLEDAESALVLPDGETARRHEDSLTRAVREVFTSGLRERWKRRLLASALFLDLSGDAEAAAISQVVAHAIGRDGFDEVALLREIVERSVQALTEARERAKAQQEQTEEQKPGS